jgi:hypothetical protein
MALRNGASIPYGSYIVIDAQPVGVHAAAGKSDGIAAGTITFTDATGGTSGGSGALNLDSRGLAEWFNANGFQVGAHSLSASYDGDDGDQFDGGDNWRGLGCSAETDVMAEGWSGDGGVRNFDAGSAEAERRATLLAGWV